MSKGLDALKEMTYSDSIWEREDYAKIIEQELKESEKRYNMLKKIFQRVTGLHLEKWTHYDGTFSYHICVLESDDLDIEITEEEYNYLLEYRYGKKENRD